MVADVSESTAGGINTKSGVVSCCTRFLSTASFFCVLLDSYLIRSIGRKPRLEPHPCIVELKWHWTIPVLLLVIATEEE
jgi:hypothetical protein